MQAINIGIYFPELCKHNIPLENVFTVKNGICILMLS